MSMLTVEFSCKKESYSFFILLPWVKNSLYHKLKEEICFLNREKIISAGVVKIWQILQKEMWNTVLCFWETSTVKETYALKSIGRRPPSNIWWCESSVHEVDFFFNVNASFRENVLELINDSCEYCIKTYEILCKRLSMDTV